MGDDEEYKFIMAENPEHKKSRSVALLDVDAASINRSQLNSSSSKMQYSIGKANRFPKQKKNDFQQKFYDIPDTKSKRSTSFGYGKKMQLGKINFKVPSPGTYSFRSEFEGKKGITISAGRDIIKQNSAFEIPKKIPGPGQYDPKNSNLGEVNKGRGPLLRSRLEDHSQKWIRQVPGPGNYETLQLLDKNLKSSNSRVQNIRSAKFSKSPRVSDLDLALKKNVPGPGQYNNSSKMAEKFSNQGGYKFPITPYQGIVDKSKAKNPGPGAYSSFSEFLH